MGSLNPENSSKQDMNDSGCVQDATMTDNGYRGQVELLDLSDDVLLYILKYCTPRDLKALGHSCPRLGALICDRTLWTRVDARSTPIGQERLRWLLDHCLSPATTELKLAGYANKYSRCLGIQDLHWPIESESGVVHGARVATASGVDVEHFLLRMWYPHLPRFAVSPRWPDKAEAESKAPKCPPTPSNSGTAASNTSKASGNVSGNSSPNPSSAEQRKMPKRFPKEFEDIRDNCKGPQFTFTAHLMKDLRNKCSHLNSLALENCNIDYKNTNIRQFPANLKKLSLRGTRCYNLPLNTSYLGKIQERLPELEYLDVSECDWFEPASLMPLSKLAFLRELYMRDCKRLTECVAYASLATRYGFRELRVIDIRGSPLADSEVSALGWLPLLEELYCAPPEDFNSSSEHTHSWNDTRATFSELDHWEKEEPEYYKIKSPEPGDLMEEDDESKNDPDGNDSPQERMGDVLLGNPWWAHERRIIVIQPNANHQPEERFARVRPAGPGGPIGPLPAEPIRPPVVEPIRPPAAQPMSPPLAEPTRPPVPEPISPPAVELIRLPAAPINPPGAQPGPSKRPNTNESQDSPKRPRLNQSCPDLAGLAEAAIAEAGLDEAGLAEAFGMRHPIAIPIIVPNDPQNCPRLRNNQLNVQPVNAGASTSRNDPQRPRCVPLRRNDMHPVMHIDVDIQRQSTIHIGSHIGYHLVSDSAILRFGRADNENVNYVHIGRNGVQEGVDPGTRPDRSNLRILSATGYRNITDRSLEHLATAAPNLLHIDFSETSVSQRGIEVFKAIRPNCEVIFSEFGKMK